jgi:chromate reductase
MMCKLNKKMGVDMITKISILRFAGSLKKDSYNKVILRAAASLVPGNAEPSIFDLEGIPPFNQDFEKEPPERVKDFKAKIRTADAILMIILRGG